MNIEYIVHVDHKKSLIYRNNKLLSPTNIPTTLCNLLNFPRLIPHHVPLYVHLNVPLCDFNPNLVSQCPGSC